MPKTSKEQALYNYTKALEYIRISINKKTFNHVNFTDLLRKCKVSTSIRTILISGGYLLEEGKGKFKSTDKIDTLTAEDLVRMNGDYNRYFLRKKNDDKILTLTGGSASPVNINIDINTPQEPFVLTWEKVNQKNGGDALVERAKVFGGWLVKYSEMFPVVEKAISNPLKVDDEFKHAAFETGYDHNFFPQSSLTFIPDVTHAWKL